MIQNSCRWLLMALFNNRSFKGYFEPLVQLLFSYWSANNFSAKVLNIRDENNSVFTLVLSVGKSWRGFKAGQFIELTVEKNGIKLTRIFSISSAPCVYKKEGVIELSIRKQKQGRVTPWLRESLTVGQYVNISVAKGDFIIGDNMLNDKMPILLIAGGSGITPFRSMITELTTLNKSNNIHLLYYNSSQQPLFKDELLSLKTHNKNLHITFIDSSQSGYMCLQHLKNYCPDFKTRHNYICGPAEMIRATEGLLLAQDVSVEDIHYEYFGSAPISSLNIKTAGKVSFMNSGLEVKSTKSQTQDRKSVV